MMVSVLRPLTVAKGPDIEHAESKGMTPRLVERVFSKITESPSSVEFTVRVSFMEIYMERIIDLLERSHLRIDSSFASQQRQFACP